MTESKFPQQFKSFLSNRAKIFAIKDDDELEGISDLQEELTQQSFLSDEQLLTEQSQSRDKRQGKLLLVALLENYCMLYDQSKEQNQKLFFVLCQHLCRMGIIDQSDFLEEFASVRSSYKKAFKELVSQAMQAVQQMDQLTKKMIMDSEYPNEIHHNPELLRVIFFLN
jgi:translation initiation factor 2-alpha kinase 1